MKRISFPNTYFGLACLFIALLVLMMGLYMGWGLLRSWMLQKHEPELRIDMQKYLELIDTVEGWRNPDIMAQVATGEHLNDLIRYRCEVCPSVTVATGIQIQKLEVLDYSSDSSKVRTRFEWWWHQVDKQTAAVFGECHVQVHTIVVVLARQDGIWKVAQSKGITAEYVSDEEFARLYKKYCN